MWHRIESLMKGRKRIVVAGVLSVFVLAGWLALLQYMETRAEQHLHELKRSDPQAYLDSLRAHHGFRDYMIAYARLRGFTEWRALPPAFLEGYWRMYDAPQDVSLDFVPRECHPAIAFTNGRVVFKDAERDLQRASYRISGDKVRVRMNDDRRLTVAPVAPEQHVHYLRVHLPDESGVAYAYRCR